MTQVFTVGVFTHSRGRDRKPLVTAYTRYYNPEWEGYCEHTVEAINGTVAKARAMAAHRRDCMGERTSEGSR